MREVAFIAAILLSVPSVAAQGTAPQTTEGVVQTAPAENDRARLICKTDKETGSRLKRNKVCKTQQEWDEMRQNTNKQLDEYGKQSPANPLPSSG